MLSISLHIVDPHGLDVVQDPRVHPVEDGGLDAPDTGCLCLLYDGDLCSCGSVDPVESLQTRSNRVGDSLVLLPSCSVSLPTMSLVGPVMMPCRYCKCSRTENCSLCKP
jgi:hypothetical protein